MLIVILLVSQNKKIVTDFKKKKYDHAPVMINDHDLGLLDHTS